MLDVCLLGTGGMMPLKKRRLTALMLRYCGHCILIDCGEGTQVAIREAGFSFKHIDVLCFTHYHADHISGLPGLLLGMGNEGREDPVLMMGPPGLRRVVESLRVIAPELPFSIEYKEISEHEPISFDGFSIEPFPVKHRITCLGYVMNVERKGKFLVEKAEKLNIPKPMWGKLQNGEMVEFENKVITPDMVMGEPRKGIKVAYCTDTRPVDTIKRAAKNSDLFICEGMFYDEEKQERAVKTGHMMYKEAAKLAKDAQVGELWLTHFSPAVVNPKEGIGVAKDIFENAFAGSDGMCVTLRFEE